MAEQSCVFCQIIEGTVYAHKVFESDQVLAFIDVRQANPGHVLVIPKAHIPIIYDLPADIGAAMMTVVVEVSQAVKTAFQAEGLSIWSSNGKCAGQEVPHLHFHVHPRKPKDNLLKVYPSWPPAYPVEEELADYARKIQAALP